MNVLQGPMAVLVALVDAAILLAPTPAIVTLATDWSMAALVQVRDDCMQCLQKDTKIVYMQVVGAQFNVRSWGDYKNQC